MRYVVGFLLCEVPEGTRHLLLLEKRRPEWQAGRFNGIGGKIEPGETPMRAMVREWKEETGLADQEWRFFCVLTGGDYEVHFFAARMFGMPLIMRRANDAGEEFVIMNFEVLAGDHHVIPNLKWLIPMAFDDPSLPEAVVMDRGISEAAHVTGDVTGELKPLTPPSGDTLLALLHQRADWHDYQSVLFDGADHADGARWHETAQKQYKAAIDVLACIDAEIAGQAPALK